jgi:hypothetical protein
MARSNVARIVPRAPSGNTEQLTIRVPKIWTDRAEALKPKLTHPGLDVSVTDIMRLALGKGLDALEAETREKSGRKK